MFPTKRCGRPTGRKPRELKCKLDTGVSVNVMPLITYKLVNRVSFTKRVNLWRIWSGMTTLRGYNGSLIKQYGVSVIVSYWNKPVLEHNFKCFIL